MPHTSRFFVATNRVKAWGRVIQNQDGAYSTDAAKIETWFIYLDFSTEDKESQQQHKNNMS